MRRGLRQGREGATVYRSSRRAPREVVFSPRPPPSLEESPECERKNVRTEVLTYDALRNAWRAGRGSRAVPPEEPLSPDGERGNLRE